MHHVIMCHRSKSLSSDAIFMDFGLQRFYSLSRGFIRFHSTTISRFGFLFISSLWQCSNFRDARIIALARHGGCHRSFQFSPRIVESFRLFLVVWINKINYSESSSIVELRFFPLPIPVSLDSEPPYQFSSKLLAVHYLIWWSFEPLSVSPRTT